VAPQDHRLRDRQGHHLLRVADQRVQVESAHLDPALARVGQQLATQVGGPLACLDDRQQAFVGRRGLRDVGQGQVRVAGDAEQEVVEVVRNAAREQAQALQLLGLLHLHLETLALLLGKSPLGDVLDHAEHARRPAVGVELEFAHAVHPAHRAVAGTHDAVLAVEGLARAEHTLLEVAGHALTIVRMDERNPAFDGLRERGVDAEQFIEGLGACPLAGRGIEFVVAEPRQALRLPELGFTVAQGALGLEPLGRVPEDAEQAGAAIKSGQPRIDVGTEHRAVPAPHGNLCHQLQLAVDLLGEVVAGALQPVCRMDVGDGQLQQLFTCVTEHEADARVGQDEAARLHVGHQQAVRRVLEQGAVAFITRAR
jgi:hypothetical protein